MRWGVGPVFRLECIAESRRWQFYAARVLLVGILLVAITSLFTSRTTSSGEVESWARYAKLGESYFTTLIGIEIALVMLVAPAATAGAICLDRSRGNLQHMMVTDLSNAEIVLGKLAARLLPVLVLIGCTWPVLAICSLLGGIDPLALTLAFGVMLTVALVGCSIAIGLSVLARRPHEVVLAVYLVWLVMLLAWPLRFVLGRLGLAAAAPYTQLLDPFMVAFAPYWEPGSLLFNDYAAFFGGSFLLSALFVGMAVWRVRAVAIRDEPGSRRASRLGWSGWVARVLPGPSLDRNPVLWREWHRSRPSAWMVRMVLLFGGTTMFFCVAGAVSIWTAGVHGTGRWWELAGFMSESVQILFGLVMIAAVAPTALFEERPRGSLDLLASTTLTTREIVFGKWLGTARFIPLLLIGPAIFGFAIAFTKGVSRSLGPDPLPNLGFYAERFVVLITIVVTILVHGLLLNSLGLLIAITIKRPSRAIAIAISACVAIHVGWPFLTVNAGLIRRTALLSGLFSAVELTNFLESGAYLREIVWQTLSCDAEVATLAAGLLWLSVRIFDECLGRMPVRPRRQPILADVAVVFAAMLVVACLCVSIRYAVNGIELNGLHGQESSLNALMLSLAIGLGLIFTGAVAALMVKFPGSRSLPDWQDGRAASARTLLMCRGRRSFGLLLLIAAGPAILGATLASAGSYIAVAPKIARIAPGNVVFRPLTPDEVAAVRSFEAGPAVRIRGGLLLIGTIVCTGVVMIVIGTAAGLGCATQRWAVIATSLAGLGLVVGWSVISLVFWTNPAHLANPWWGWISPWWVGTMSLTGSSSFLLEFLMSRLDSFPELWWAVVAGDVFVMALGTIAFGFIAHKFRPTTEPAAPPVPMIQPVLE